MKRFFGAMFLVMLILCACGKSKPVYQDNAIKEKKIAWEVQLLGTPLQGKSYNSDFDSEIPVIIDGRDETEVKCITLCTMLKPEKAKAYQTLKADEFPDESWFDNKLNCYCRLGKEWDAHEDESIAKISSKFDALNAGVDYNDQLQYYGRTADFSADGKEMTIRYDFFEKTENDFVVDRSFSMSGKADEGIFPMDVKRTSENTALAICSDGYVRQYDLSEDKMISESDADINCQIYAFGDDCIAAYDSSRGGVRIIDAQTALEENIIMLEEDIGEEKQQLAKVAVLDDEVYFLTPNGFYVAGLKDKEFKKQDCSYDLGSVMMYPEQTYFLNFSVYDGRAYLCMYVNKDSGGEILIYSLIKEG